MLELAKNFMITFEWLNYSLTFTFLLFYLFTFASCPVVLILNVAELNLLAGDCDLLEVSHLVLPLLLEIYAVAVGELD